MGLNRVVTLAKVLGAAVVIAIFFVVSISRLPFTTVSPDAIRFMHFAQINADRAVSEGGTVKTAVTAALRTIKGSNNYDLTRGRLVQGMVFAIDGVTRWLLPSTLNWLMILFLVLNAGMAARLATRDVTDGSQRLDLSLIATVVLLTSSLVLSPVMLVTLYGKYIWITFLLAHFLARRASWKVFWLIPAAYADEIGLFAVALVVFFHVGRMVLLRTAVLAERGNDTRSLVRAFLIATAGAVNVILVFFGISAIVFNAGAETFSSFARRGMQEAVPGGGAVWRALHGVLWRAEEVVLGLTTGIPLATTVLGGAAIVLIAVAVVRRYRGATPVEPGGWHRLHSGIRAMILHPGLSFYVYWTVLLVAISWLILPGQVYNLNQYSYPAAIIIGLLFVKALADSLSSRRATLILCALAIAHLALLPRITDETSRRVVAELLPDSTVSVEEVRNLHRSVDELRSGKRGLFDHINNGQEIDFSGTWYYSRVRSFGIATEPHWPVQGTVRVLAWPTHIAFKCSKRNFLYTRPEFTDMPCPGT